MLSLTPSFSGPIRLVLGFLEEVPKEVMLFLTISAITGFIITSVLIINLNRRAFNYVMQDNAKKFWWLFAILAVVLLSLFLYAFTFLFGRLFG